MAPLLYHANLKMCLFRVALVIGQALQLKIGLVEAGIEHTYCKLQGSSSDLLTEYKKRRESVAIVFPPPAHLRVLFMVCTSLWPK